MTILPPGLLPDPASIYTDIAQWHCAHTTECLRQNRCVCGTYDRQNADFEQRLKLAMERYPQVPLGEPFETVLRDNLWDLYATDPKPIGVADSDGGECD